MAEVFIPVLAIAVLIALIDWRLGLFAAVVIAILQDAFRKIAPGQPVYFVVLVGMVFAATYISAFSRGVPLAPAAIVGWRRRVGSAFTVVLAILAVQFVQGLLRTGSAVVPAIGLVSYLAPIPAVVVGYQFAVRQGPDRVRHFIAFYLICAVAGLATVFVQYSGVDWPILGDVGGQLLIYDKYLGLVVPPMAGVFRTSEVAAWHCATCACFLLLLATYRKLPLWKACVAMAVVILVLAAGSLTGRRKLFVEVAVFCAAYAFLLILFRRRAVRLLLGVGGMGLILLGAVTFGLVPDISDTNDESNYRIYASRTSSVFGDVQDRFSEMGLDQLSSAYQWSGVWGGGLGIGSQGAQYFGADDDNSRGAAEGGLGKIVLEIGVIGLAAMGWLVVALTRLVWGGMRTTSELSPDLGRLSFGLVAFLIANAAAFSVATQVYADLFILLMLGTCLGFLLAMPVLAARESQITGGAIRRPLVRSVPARRVVV